MPGPRSVTSLASRSEPLPAAAARAPELRLCSEGVSTREYNPLERSVSSASAQHPYTLSPTRFPFFADIN